MLKIIRLSTTLLLLTFWLGGFQLRAQHGHGMMEPRSEMLSAGQELSMKHTNKSMPSGQDKRSGTNQAAPQQANSTSGIAHQTPANQLTSNTKLSSQLQGFFPLGTNLAKKAGGFKKFGDFVAAAHVSHNLGIPFDDLRTMILSGKYLGQAIHELKPYADSDAATKTAKEQAKTTLHNAGL
jgi:hypothetical protein